jgi:hypothetical protein
MSSITLSQPTIRLYDENGFLHSDKGAALVHTFPLFPHLPPEKHYYIHGIEFSMWRWCAIVDKTIPLHTVLSLNFGQRRAIVKYLGIEKLFYNARPQCISKTKKGNELFNIPFRHARRKLSSFWLRYKCPSTGKIYISGVDPEFLTHALDMSLVMAFDLHQQGSWLADCAMAWKLGLQLTEYYDIKEEA